MKTQLLSQTKAIMAVVFALMIALVLPFIFRNINLLAWGNPERGSLSLANSGYSSVFYVGSTTSPTSYISLLECKSIKVSGFQVPALDVTHLLSPNTTEEYTPGIIKPGQLDITGNFIGDSTQLAMLSTAVAQTVVYWKITSPMQKGAKTLTLSGTGFWTKIEKGPWEANKPIEYNCSFQITGTVTESVA